MPGKRVTPSSEPLEPLPPVFTAEARESQLIALAYDLAEKRLREGTASAQEVTHLLKAGTVQRQVDLETARLNNRLLIAKTEQIGDADQQRQLLNDAIAAFTGYKGEDVPLLDDEDAY